MKDIGIVTWYFGANYGALAQSLALYKAIELMGYNCTMINYRPKGYKKTILISSIPPKGKRLSRINQTLHGLTKCIILSNSKYFNTSSKIHNEQDIDALNLDCLIFGSDAIFNIKHPLCDSVYFGVGIHTKKITYSPSCEYASEEIKLPDSYCESLNEMSAISVRDINTYKLIKNNIGKEPLITVDPTFLYSFHDIETSLNWGDYILLYTFSDWYSYKENIIDYAKTNRCKLISVGKQLDWVDNSYPAASFELWISAFRKAKCIITDSFHGTVFSLKNKKPIVLCGRTDKQAKIDSLLNQFGIEIELYKGGSINTYLSRNQIDYDKVENTMEVEIRNSFEYLKQAIGE